jgi:hypothetical protein
VRAPPSHAYAYHTSYEHARQYKLTHAPLPAHKHAHTLATWLSLARALSV